MDRQPTPRISLGNPAGADTQIHLHSPGRLTIGLEQMTAGSKRLCPPHTTQSRVSAWQSTWVRNVAWIRRAVVCASAFAGPITQQCDLAAARATRRVLQTLVHRSMRLS